MFRGTHETERDRDNERDIDGERERIGYVLFSFFLFTLFLHMLIVRRASVNNLFAQTSPTSVGLLHRHSYYKANVKRVIKGLKPKWK